jgi:hypothetical protein
LLEEDTKENEVSQVERTFNDVQLHLSTERQFRDILGNADKFLMRATLDIQDAEHSATADIWNVGVAFAEMAENNVLSRCQQHVSQVEMLISQAQRIQVSDIILLEFPNDEESFADSKVMKQPTMRNWIYARCSNGFLK